MRWLCLAIGFIPASAGTAVVQASAAWEKPLAPGLVYRTEIDPGRPMVLHAIRMTPASPALRWQTELAGGLIQEDSGNGRETPTKMALRTKALVAINGDFFASDHGSPIGLIVRNGELLNTPVKSRAVFAWGPKDTAIGMGNCKLTMSVAGGPEAPLDALNQPIGENGLGFYTSAQGLVKPKSGAVVVKFRAPSMVLSPSMSVSLEVSEVTTDTSPFIVAKDTAVIIAGGVKKPRVAGLTVGAQVRIRTEVPGFDWEKLDNLIGGGPFLVRGGEISVDGVEEGFPSSFTDTRHPRSAIGRTAAGDIWLVAIEGRQPQSAGASLAELAATMRRLGCVDAINLDGGGSTSLSVLGVPVARPSDGIEREVADGILIFGPQIQTPPGRLRMVTDPKVAVDGTLNARVDIEGKAVPAMDVIWGSRGSAWVDQGGHVRFAAPGQATLIAQVYGQILSADISWKK